jgi:molybdopterin converting factor small subunit
VSPVRLRLFAAAREAAGRASDAYDPAAVPTLGDLVALAAQRYGEAFTAVLATARIWVNGDEPPEGDRTPLGPGDEVAVLPPVSGGAAESCPLATRFC